MNKLDVYNELNKELINLNIIDKEVWVSKHFNNSNNITSEKDIYVCLVTDEQISEMDLSDAIFGNDILNKLDLIIVISTKDKFKENDVLTKII
ncbi:hypothetical protein [uncultured Clostridium sp.]|uniref:hypothetical protein n=1 Tax=uncultured Clostridium sp. TaxID=59620 RepID=UPI0026F409F9|nr:hypothetical protein [uncultured Clostridium sp.]